MSDNTTRPIAVVVDDEALVRMYAADILEEAGYAPLEASDGEQALELLHLSGAADVQLLFTDVQMPGRLNGFALAREVARIWPQIAIVVVSGLDKPEPGDLPEGAKFIGKPFRARLLHDHLRDLQPREKQPKALKG